MPNLPTSKTQQVGIFRKFRYFRGILIYDSGKYRWARHYSVAVTI